MCRQSRYRCTNSASTVKYETFTARYIAIRCVIRWIYDSSPSMTDDNGIFLREERARARRSMDGAIHYSGPGLALSNRILSRARARTHELIWNTRKRQSELIFLRDKVMCGPKSRAVCFSPEPSYIWPGDVFQFGRRYRLCYFIWISVLVVRPSFSSFLPPALLLGDVNPTKGCAEAGGWYTRGTEAFSSVRHFIP